MLIDYFCGTNSVGLMEKRGGKLAKLELFCAHHACNNEKTEGHEHV
jgi:hypothetical protein